MINIVNYAIRLSKMIEGKKSTLDTFCKSVKPPNGVSRKIIFAAIVIAS